MQQQIRNALKTPTWHLHKDWVSVQVLQGADTMRGLDVQGIYYEKCLWGKMGREPGELPGTGSDHMKRGEESLHWKHLRLNAVLKKQGCQKSWSQSHSHQQCLPRASLPATPTLSFSVLHKEWSAGSLASVPMWWWRSECTGGVLNQLCSAQSEIREVLLHGHHNRPVFFTRPHPVPIFPTYFKSTWISSAPLPWSIQAKVLRPSEFP